MSTVIVVRERATRMTLSAIVPMKRASRGDVVRRILAFVKELWMEASTSVLKSDQELAIADILNEVCRLRKAQRFVEQSPVAPSGSKWDVERAIQSAEGHIRTV